MGGKSKQGGGSDVILSKKSKELLGINIGLATEQLNALKQAVALYGQLNQMTGPQITGLGEELNSNADIAMHGERGVQDLSDEAIQKQLDYIRNGGRASPEQEGLISDIAERTLARGRSDLNTQFQEGMDTLRNNLAPSRGLRASDSPVIDRGGTLLKENMRQYSNLENSVRATQDQMLLDYPAKDIGTITDVSTAAKDFQLRLRQQAIQNRLALTGLTSQSGLGLSTSYNAPAGFAASAATDKQLGRSTNSASQQSKLDSAVGGFSSSMSGMGSFMGGLGSMMG